MHIHARHGGFKCVPLTMTVSAFPVLVLVRLGFLVFLFVLWMQNVRIVVHVASTEISATCLQREG
jgi:hypothetical protein